ncbi:hypothetical protein JD844_018689 [Phrynosoma platyrhinos]|uniref:Nuclear receptor coactivator 6 n=1 Tax=Phrynosoma platyrhinos TaxID=52577 RepID=A0ABQ7SP23_PHRPL|nr:hypothetical protein JD844_018689 [Phrynosoma platyrhinos]
MGHKLSEFPSRPPGKNNCFVMHCIFIFIFLGYPAQPMEQRSLQQMPPQLLQHGQQQPPPPPPTPQQTQSQQQQQQQQMMMMLMMQQDAKSVRLPVSQGVHQPRGPLNVETQRMPVQQGGNMSVMVSLQGTGSVPPSPDKQRISVASNQTLVNNARKMAYADNVQNPTTSPLGEVPSVPSVSEGNGPEVTSPAAGPQNNIGSHLIVSQSQLMMAGPKPGPSPMSAPQGASPQQQSNPLPGTHSHHFQNVANTSQTSRPKTPNRASPRPYYPQTPNNRPPSTEPSEISLSPERLNASIAGLFPPQINIPLPPRPNLNRGFDQQGLNPTTLKAIGQAPSNLTMNSQSSFVSPQTHKLDPMAINSGKQTNAGGAKRASPSNSRRSSPGSSRKTTPSPGRQNSKAAKLTLPSQQNPSLMQNMDLQRSIMVGPPSLQTPMPGSFQSNGMLTTQNPTVPMSIMTGIPEDNKESFSVSQDATCQSMQVIPMNKEHNIDPKNVSNQEIKILVHEEQQKREAPSIESNKVPSLEENNTIISPAMREAPTSLSQLLDNSGAPNVTIKPSGLHGLEVPPAMSCADEFKKASAIPPPQQDSSCNKESVCSLSLPPNAEACSTQAQELAEINSGVSQNMSPVIQRPVSSASISTSLPPNQITVFVTSNPITSSSNTSAPLPSHLQPALMPTVVTMPNVGNKVMTSEGQTTVQSNARPQFITPVFINSSSIIQVMKGSQPSTIPATPMTSNSNLIPQSVAVVGPLHLPQKIKFTSGPAPPSSFSNTSVSSMPTSRSLVINSLATPISLPSPSPTAPSSTSSHPAVQQVKDFNPEEMNSQICASVDPCADPSSQSGTVVSPPRAHSPGSINRRSPVSSTKGKGKLDRIGQFLLTKACKKVTDSFDKEEEQYAAEGEVEGQAQDVSVPNSLEMEQLPIELEDSTVASPAPTLLKQSTSGTGHLNISGTTTVSAPVSLSLPGSTPSTNVLSTVTTPVITDNISPVPTTNGNLGNLPIEQVGIGPQDEKAEAHHELSHNMASSGQTPVVTPESTVPRTELEADSAVIIGLVNDPKENCEKCKTPSRRNSRTEESTVVQEAVENGQRKRSSRPASASSTAKETNTSGMQSKRRKSK